MPTMPGQAVPLEDVTGPNNEELKRRKAFKPELAKPQADTNPFAQYLQDTDKATKLEAPHTSVWERFKANFSSAQDFGSTGINELGKIRDARLMLDSQMPDGKDYDPEQAKKDANWNADYLAEKRQERQFKYDNMDSAESPLDYAAAIGGGLLGSVIDPLSLANPEVKIGSTGWRYASPVLSRMLDSSVSNAAMNVALNGVVQVEEGMAGLRDTPDLQSLATDAAAGALFGAPFGYLNGRAARDELAHAVTDTPPAKVSAPESAPDGGGDTGTPPPPPEPATPEQTTPESLTAAHEPKDIKAAQEQLFGENIGTRNLSPEQLNKVDDFLNADKPYGENVPRETPQPESGITQNADSPNPEALPPVRDIPQSQAEPLPQMPEQRQPEGSQNQIAPDSPGQVQAPAPLVAGDYQDFKPEELLVDAMRFQFKGGSDAEGVVDTLKKVKTWDRKKSGTVLVWQDKEGRNFIVDGHQRYGLAKRLKAEGQDPVLHAMVWREADGITADEARIFAADVNISQGSGTAIDAAKILRARPQFIDNLPKNSVTEHAVGLSRLSDDAFGMVVNGSVPPEYAALVGKLASDKTTHAQILDVLAKNEPASAGQAESMVRDVLSAPEVESTMTDMFGSAQVTQILFKERAQILTSAASAIRKHLSSTRNAAENKAFLETLGNKIDTKATIERAQSDAEILATLQATARRKGPVADALAAAAKSLNDGTPRQVAVRDFIDSIRGQAKGASPDGAGLPSSSQSIAARLGGYKNTESPAFQKWFGDSKTVDGNGDPIVLYHGTNQTFQEFEAGRFNGIFFTESPDIAENYTGTKGADWHYNPQEGGQILPVYVALKNPAEIDAAKWADPKTRFATLTAALEEAKAQGHDGAVISNMLDMGGTQTQYVAFEPNQIKSIFNRGTFDATDPRIAFNAPAAGPTNSPAFKQWYGNSKLVDGKGEPIKVYHGTSKPFSKVDMQKGAQGVFWVTSDKAAIEAGEVGAQGRGTIMELYAKIENPAGWKEYDQFSIGELIGRGYDGVVLPEKDGTFTAFVFEPTQIKSAQNRGTWDAGDARIAFSTRQSGPSLFDVGADKKPQAVIPGAEKVGGKTLAEMRAAAPLKAKAPQKSMDFGMFGSGKDQLDLVDMVKRQDVLFKVKGEGDYLDFSPSGTVQSADIGGVSISYAARDGELEIISLRSPTQSRNTGLATAALGEFLRKADEQGMPVRANLRPMDRATTEEGLKKLYSRFGFEPTGRVKAEVFRKGPDAKTENMRQLDDGLDQLTALVNANAPIPEIESHPFILGAVRRMEALPLTEKQPGFMSDAWKEARKYNFPGEEVQGYDNAVAKLTDMAKDFSTGGKVRTERKATILLGPPAAGKSTFAEKYATARFAAIVDPDEAKKVIPEFNQGIGANAVHEESAMMAASVADNLLNEGANVVVPKVGANAKGIRKLIESLKKEGYEVDLVNVNVTYDNAFRRMVRRFVKTGRLTNPEYVRAVGETPSETYKLLREQGVADRYAEIDGNGKDGEPPPILDDTGATEGIPGLGGSREQGNGSNVRTSPESAGAGIAFKARRPADLSKMNVERMQGGVPAVGTAPKAPKIDRLGEVADVLRSVTGAPVRQGRLARAPKGQKVAGQYDRNQGVIRLADMQDFATQTHETAHSLETEWGRDLHNLKLTNRAELEPMAYAGADPTQIVSEGFAEWFRHYVTHPAYAAKNAPQFTQAFEGMLKARAPQQLAKIQDAQKRFVKWTQTPSAQAIAADVVSSKRMGTIAEAVAKAGGPREALGEFISNAYTSTIDKLNPINIGVDELLKVYERRTGQALDLKTANDPYRLARLLADSYSAGHIDAMHGVVPFHGVVSEGASLSSAITTALGSEWRGWDDVAMADFASYLISRRSMFEYDRFMAGELPNPPGKFTRGDYEVTIQELEATHPNYKNAADMVYEWGRNMLRKKYESGFISEKVYKELLGRKDYVPLMRDMRDLQKEGDGQPSQNLRNSVLKAFKGSNRSVINPLESMLADAYQFNALMKRNEIFRALDDLAQSVGPGGGAIVERIPSTQLTGTKVSVEQVMRSAAKEAGLNPEDIDHLTTFVDDMLGEHTHGTVFKAGDINEKGEPIIYVWRDGKKQALRLADGDLGRSMYDALTGMNKEMSNLFVNIMALPSTMVRYGVTTAPHFIVANYVRDQISSWVLTNDGFIPFISGAKGIYDEVTGAEISRIYNSFGGIVGGQNVASLDKGRVKRDISALNKAGYHVKRFAGIQGFSELTGISETGTRLAVFSNAFKRAKRDGLTAYEAAAEAAFQARDLMDFGRHGSQTHTARRLVTFLNAAVQGLEKGFRVLSAEGAIKKAITPYINHKAGRPLSARDKGNLAKSASAWAKLTATGLFGLGLSYLYSEDPEYEEISDYLRATHWMVKKGPGEWYAIPKPFELGFVSNLFERSFDSVYGRNPIAMQSFLSGLYEVTAPPTGIALFQTGYELAHNTDGMGRDIVGQDIAGFEPWRQYTAQTSEIAKSLGLATNTSPAMIDHAIQGWGASWGKIITDGSTSRAQGKSVVDTIAGSMTNRFVRNVARGSTSAMQFWSLISESTGAMAQAATTYQDQFENAGPAIADQMLANKDENTKAFALLKAHFQPDVERLHPLVRAKDSMAVIAAMRRDIAGNDIKTIEDEEVKVVLSPTQRQAEQEFLARISMIEARNALIVIGVPGWQQKKLMETASLWEDVRSISPDLADEIEARMTKKKVYDFEAVREAWPDVKERVLEDRQDADFSDLLAGME